MAQDSAPPEPPRRPTDRELAMRAMGTPDEEAERDARRAEAWQITRRMEADKRRLDWLVARGI